MSQQKLGRFRKNEVLQKVQATKNVSHKNCSLISINVMNCTIKKKKSTYTSPDASMFEPDGRDFLAFLAGM